MQTHITTSHIVTSRAHMRVKGTLCSDHYVEKLVIGQVNNKKSCFMFIYDCFDAKNECMRQHTLLTFYGAKTMYSYAEVLTSIAYSCAIKLFNNWPGSGCLAYAHRINRHGLTHLLCIDMR